MYTAKRCVGIFPASLTASSGQGDVSENHWLGAFKEFPLKGVDSAARCALSPFLLLTACIADVMARTPATMLKP